MNTDDPFISQPDGPGREINLTGLAPGQLAGAGRFRLRRLLGQGGMGVVWQADDARLGIPVALKFLPSAIRGDPVALELLRTETRRSLRLSHPNIVRIHDLHEPPGEEVFFAMEYVDGPTLGALRTRHAARVLPWDELAPFLEQLCDGLGYAHAENVIHRDLKPANLMVDARGRLKLADFGVACVVSETMTRLTGSAVAGGTLIYMSPQQADGLPPQATDDLYSLGATLYELLTGEPPFCRGDIAHQVRTAPPLPLTERLASRGLHNPVPAHVESAVLACLSKDPADRPPTARALAAQLGLAPPPARRPGERGEPWRARRPLAWLRRHAGLALGGAALAGAIGLAIVARPWLNRRPGPGPTPGPTAAAPSVAGSPWENSLGMRFVPVGSVLVSVWETRVRDFEAYVRGTGDASDRPMDSIGKDGEGPHGFSWKNPGHPQTPDHPVVGIRWSDANGFCDWLTTEERRTGRLRPDQRYRLPTDAEWSAAVDEDRTAFPWGQELPPPPGAGNYAGTEVQTDADRPPPGVRSRLGGYRDAFLRTAPVGSFGANRHGLHDLGGNVLEWCAAPGAEGGLTNLLRGGSWDTGTEEELQSSWRLNMPNGFRSERFGFRCVLDPGRPPAASSPEPDPETASLPLRPPPPVFTNSLGLPFVGVGRLWMALLETRVRDFAAFAGATGYDATREEASSSNPWLTKGRHWRSPGFPQTPDDPVVLVHTADAEAFCAWLETEERRRGLLAPGLHYRLPTDEEWSEAAFARPWRFPWGNEAPFPPGAGNYAGSTRPGDPFEFTAPVGRFAPNPLGLRDVGGNAAEWCRGRRGHPAFVAARGGSWESGHIDHLQSSQRRLGDFRSPATGFRLVLEHP